MERFLPRVATRGIRIHLTWAAAALALAGTPALAAAGPRLVIWEVDASAFPQVRLTVTAAERGCEPMSLSAGAVTVLEDGRAATGVTLQRTTDATVPVHTLLLMEGGATGETLDAARAAGAAVVDAMPSKGEASLAAFGGRLQVLQPSSNDRASLRSAVSAASPAGEPALLDALDQVVTLAEAAEPACRVAVVLTSGRDAGSATPVAALVDRLRTAGVAVVAVGLGPSPARGVLDQLAQVPGVSVVHATDPAQSRAAYEAAVRRLQTAYLITYRSQLPADDQPHRVTVRLATNPPAQAEHSFVARAAPLAIDVTGLPETGAVTEATTVEVTVTSGVAARVALLVDGTERAALTAPPYRFSLDPAAETPGAHLVTLRADAAAGRAVERSVLLMAGAAGPPGAASVWPAALALFALTGAAGLVVLGLVQSGRQRRRGLVLVEPPAPDPWATEQLTEPATTGAQGAPALEAVLEVRLPGGATTLLPLLGEEVLVGRSAECTLVVDDPRVSRRHARLWFEDGRYWVEDLASRNGTLLNGGAIARCPLEPGDTLRLGDTELVLRSSDSAESGAWA